MISKCANPLCDELFLYFRVESCSSEVRARTRNRRRRVRQTGRADAHFWLCGHCAATMTIVIGQSGIPAVITTSLVEPQSSEDLLRQPQEQGWSRRYCDESAGVVSLHASSLLNPGGFDVSVRSSLLFVCDTHTAVSHFRQSLRDTGLRLISGRGTESAILSSTEPFDGILVYYEDLQVSSAVALQLKTLLPHTPVVLISIGDEMAPPFGLDAVCYTTSLDAEMARIIAMLFRDLLIHELRPANVPLQHQDEYPRRPVLDS